MIGGQCIGPRLHKSLTLNGTFFLSKVVWSFSGNIAYGFSYVMLSKECEDNIAQDFFLMQSFLELFGQHCIGFLPVQCCPRSIRRKVQIIFFMHCCQEPLGQYCIGFRPVNIVQDCTALHRIFS